MHALHCAKKFIRAKPARVAFDSYFNEFYIEVQVESSSKRRHGRKSVSYYRARGYRSISEAEDEQHIFRVAVEVDLADNWEHFRNRGYISLTKCPRQKTSVYSAVSVQYLLGLDRSSPPSAHRPSDKSVILSSLTDPTSVAADEDMLSPPPHHHHPNSAASACVTKLSVGNKRQSDSQDIVDEEDVNFDTSPLLDPSLAADWSYDDDTSPLVEGTYLSEKNLSKLRRLNKSSLSNLKKRLAVLDERSKSDLCLLAELTESLQKKRCEDDFLLAEYMEMKNADDEVVEVNVVEYGDYSTAQVLKIHMQCQLARLILSAFCKIDLEEKRIRMDYLSKVDELYPSSEQSAEKVVETRALVKSFSSEMHAFFQEPTHSRDYIYKVAAENCSISESLAASWWRQFRRLEGMFAPDMRCHPKKRASVLEQLSLDKPFIDYMIKEEMLSIDKCIAWLAGQFSSEQFQENKLAQKYNPPAKSTTHLWMLRHGAKRVRHTKSYYTDRHNAPDIVKDREDRYIPLQLELLKRKASWYGVREDEASDAAKAFTRIVIGLHLNDQIPSYRVDEHSNRFIFVHAMYLKKDALIKERREYQIRSVGGDGLGGEVGSYLYSRAEMEAEFNRSKARNKGECPYGHREGEPCYCNRPIKHVTQDESCFKKYQKSAFYWSIGGRRQLRKKHDGPAYMVSGMSEESRGLGIKLTPAELQAVNEFRAVHGRPPFTHSPGLYFMSPGKNKDGYFGSEDFLEQVTDILDVYETLHPGHQIVIQVDWSGNHAKAPTDGLNTKRMNVYFGGKSATNFMRETELTSDCMGPHPRWLKPGDKQHMVFQPGDDIHVWRGQQNKKDPKPKPPMFDEYAKDENGEIQKDEKEKFIIERPGYIGKVKGLKQVLYERGFDVDDMVGKGSRKEESKEEGDELLTAFHLLSQCADFQAQRNAIEERVMPRGHRVAMTVKYHPELEYIEYLWGKGKNEFAEIGGRDHFSDSEFKKAVVQCLQIPIEQVWTAAAHVMRRLAIYMDMRDNEDVRKRVAEAENVPDVVNKLLKEQRTHRDAYKIDPAAREAIFNM